MNETLVNAKFNALIQQRDVAQNAYVNLAGEYAVLLERLKALENEISQLRPKEEVDNAACHDSSAGVCRRQP